MKLHTELPNDRGSYWTPSERVIEDTGYEWRNGVGVIDDSIVAGMPWLIGPLPRESDEPQREVDWDWLVSIGWMNLGNALHSVDSQANSDLWVKFHAKNGLSLCTSNLNLPLSITTRHELLCLLNGLQIPYEVKRG